MTVQRKRSCFYPLHENFDSQRSPEKTFFVVTQYSNSCFPKIRSTPQICLFSGNIVSSWFLAGSIFQKVLLNWSRSVFKHLGFSRNKISIIHPGPNQKLNVEERVSKRKIKDFLACIRDLVLQKIQAKPFSVQFSQNLNSCFTKTGGFIFCIRIGIENLQVVESVWVGRLSFFVPWIRVLAVRKFRKVLFSLNSLDFQTFTSEPVEIPFSQSRSH